MAEGDVHYDAWNPGLTSEIPRRLLPKVTLYRPENALVGYEDARAAADFCGLRPQDMIALNAGRLVIHEMLIRVTADLHVPDGPNYEELGLNLRSMAARILNKHIQPRMDDLEARFAALRAEAEARLAEILERDIFARHQHGQQAAPGFLARLMGRKPPPPETERPEILALAEWKAAVGDATDPLEAACLAALRAIVGGMVGQRGRLFADCETILRLAANRVCNDFGSRRIGEWIKPIIAEAAEAEGYRMLPFQDKPFIMNVKGASAAGKSTIRPLQKELAERLEIPWQDFALISPDYWRKFLLDYKSLGPDYKYAAMLTGQELEIVDKKLDRYMQDKAMRREMPHLLIDRFRFDSFSSPNSNQADGKLLSRFGDTVFLFLIITPPAETVERAWTRGLTTGRFKAVDDLLYHNIEAYTGMPQLFLSWVNKKRQKIHVEFLDNSVPLGQRPRTVAFGWNGEVTIIDPDCMRAMNRYRNINIDARQPEDVFLEAENLGKDILAECVEAVPKVTFADPATLEIRGQTQDGVCIYEADRYFERLGLAGRLRQPDGDAPGRPPNPARIDAERERRYTVGDWDGG